LVAVPKASANACPVLDLPQLYTKPSAKLLLETLALFTTTPLSWESSDIDDIKGREDISSTQSQPKPVQINPEGVTRYLTGIVSNDLRWIEDDAIKEEIWNQAGARLSERSGRTAMGAMSRQFRIPSPAGSFELSIHEPTMLGDDLGLKTWAASYLLAKRLHTFDLVKDGRLQKPRVLELGSGTGLVGLAMAGLGADVLLTDLPSIHSNLARNVKDNVEVVRQNYGSASSGILDWSNPADLRVFTTGTPETGDPGVRLHQKFALVLAADSLYSPDHPRMLVDSIAAWLSDDDNARVIVEFPYRDAYLPEIKNFREGMENIGLIIVEEGEENGYDDWGESGKNGDEDDRAVVTCWWSSWGRRAQKPA
jgi:predicted nicotinamide N-methyase